MYIGYPLPYVHRVPPYLMYIGYPLPYVHRVPPYIMYIGYPGGLKPVPPDLIHYKLFVGGPGTPKTPVFFKTPAILGLKNPLFEP